MKIHIPKNNLFLSTFFYLLLFTVISKKNAFSQLTTKDFVLKNITIIDVITGKLKKQDVFISSGKIFKIGNLKLKSETAIEIIDCSNKFLLPGYYDMHVHIDETFTNFDYKLLCYNYLINGITSIRVMRYNDNNEKYSDSIKSNKIIGPTFNLCQPEIEYFSGFGKMSKSFDDYKAKGYTFVKYLSGMPYPHLDSISKMLKFKKLQLVGHAHNNNLQNAINLNFKSIEHLKPFTEYLKKDSISLYDTLINLIYKKDIFVCPTINWYCYSWDQIPKNILYNLQELQYHNKIIVTKWINDYENYEKDFILAKSEQYLKEKKEFERTLLQFDNLLKHMYESKNKIIIGSDDSPFTIPGYGFHREIECFKKAKISNLDIIKSATLNGSTCLMQQINLGSIEVNKIADLVILNENPLINISNLKQINAIIKNGNYFPVEELIKFRDSLLQIQK